MLIISGIMNVHLRYRETFIALLALLWLIKHKCSSTYPSLAVEHFTALFNIFKHLVLPICLCFKVSDVWHFIFAKIQCNIANLDYKYKYIYEWCNLFGLYQFRMQQRKNISYLSSMHMYVVPRRRTQVWMFSIYM